MRIMSLDYGSKTVGVAVSDPLGITAQGVEIIRREKETKLRQTLARIEALIKEYQVDGVMELVLTACHTYAIESHYVRKTAAEMNVPYLGLEVDFSSGDAGQISTRLSAFVELLQK